MSDQIPARNAPEYRWWLAGAKAEAEARVEGMNEGGREVHDLVKTMAQMGDSRDDIADMVANVYTCEWPLWRRLALAWDVVWGPCAMRIRTALSSARRRKPMRDMKRATILAALTAALALVLGMLTAAPATSAGTSCVWIISEARGNGHVREAGSKECESWSTVTRIPWGDSVDDKCEQSFRVVLVNTLARYCNIPAWAYTTTEPPTQPGPPGSKTRQIADSMKAKAATHGLTLQFARVDGLGRTGCPSQHPTWLASTYWPSANTGTPGKGLIRVSAGPNPENCLRWWVKGWNTAKHEIAHALIERTCGTTNPPIAKGRVEPVTGAYSAQFLGNTDDTEAGPDKWRAARIHEGRCE